MISLYLHGLLISVMGVCVYGIFRWTLPELFLISLRRKRKREHQ